MIQDKTALDDRNISIKLVCNFCSKTFIVKDIPLKGYSNWRQGTLIQNAMPEVDLTTRESLISGLCPICQDEVFG